MEPFLKWWLQTNDTKTETHLSPAAYQRKQCGNFRRWSGLHKRTHTLTGTNVCIKEAWRIGLRLNYRLMLREALFFTWKKRIMERETKWESLTGRGSQGKMNRKRKRQTAVKMASINNKCTRLAILRCEAVWVSTMPQSFQEYMSQKIHPKIWSKNLQKTKQTNKQSNKKKASVSMLNFSSWQHD